MHPRRTFWTLSAFALLLGAAFVAALAPLPTVLGSSSGPQEGEAGSAGNETEPPSNETQPPGTHTQPPGNHTQPPNGTNGTLPAPEVAPERQSLRGSVGQTLAFEVVVTNPAKESQHVAVTLSAPLGWTATVGQSSFTLGSKDSVVLNGTVRSHSLLASSGTVRIHVQGQDGGDDAFLDVCFGSALQPCPPPAGNSTNPNGTKPPKNETKPPSNDTKPPTNDTKPPQNETKPPANETQPPQNETAEAPAPAQASVEPIMAPDAEASLSVEAGPREGILLTLGAPDRTDAAPGERAARLV